MTHHFVYFLSILYILQLTPLKLSAFFFYRQPEVRLVGSAESFGFAALAMRPRGSVVNLAFTRYSFTLNLSRTSQPSFYCPLYLHCSHYYNTIARPMRNIRPPPDPPCVCYAPYNIGSGNIV